MIFWEIIMDSFSIFSTGEKPWNGREIFRKSGRENQKTHEKGLKAYFWCEAQFSRGKRKNCQPTYSDKFSRSTRTKIIKGTFQNLHHKNNYILVSQIFKNFENNRYTNLGNVGRAKKIGSKFAHYNNRAKTKTWAD